MSSHVRPESSASAIQAAEQVGAAEVPSAAHHLQLAREAMARAGDLAAAGQEDEAESMLLRAQADAELAIALAREQGEVDEARDAMLRVLQMRGAVPADATPDDAAPVEGEPQYTEETP